MTKKIAPRGEYDRQYDRTVKRLGRWRGRVVYTKYKAKKKVRPVPYIKKGFDILIVPDGCYKPDVILWGKIVYSKLS